MARQAGKTQQQQPVVLVWGEDEFSVKKRAGQLYQEWSKSTGGFDHETIDAASVHSGDALRVLARLREALQTLPFFGGNKVVWFKNCNFLGEDRVSQAAAVSENLAALADELKRFSWDNVRLIISAGKIDRRKSFYKTLQTFADVEHFPALSLEDENWSAKAEQWVDQSLRPAQKSISEEARARLVACVGPNLRLLSQEIEKLILYVGDRPRIDPADIDTIVSQNKQARAFELAEALGDRDLPRLLRALDDELWEMKTDTQKSEIGLLYGLINKTRVLILLKELLKEGWLKPETQFNRFKAQLERIPEGFFPEDKRLNPLSIHPYVLFKAVSQVRRYTRDELIRAMETLLECNRRLIFSSLDSGLILQQTLVQIVGSSDTATATATSQKSKG